MNAEESRELNEALVYEAHWNRSEAFRDKPQCTFCGARVDSLFVPCHECDKCEEW